MSLRSLMHHGRLAAIWLFWPGLALVSWGELAGGGGIEIDVWDKLLHFTAYFGLAGMAWVALGTARHRLQAVLGLILFGGVLEIIQGATGRDMSFWDEVANALGAGAGMLAGIGFLYLSRLVGSGPAD